MKTGMKSKLFGNEEKMRKQQLELISMLNRWYHVKEDLIFAFEKCVDSQIGEPTAGYIKEFLVRIKGGLGVEKSLDLFAESFEDPQFNNFITHIRFNFKYKGDVGELLDNIETQFIKVEQERTRRKITTSKDRKYLTAFFMLTPAVAIKVLVFNETAAHVFFHTILGRLSAILCSVFYIAGFALFIKSSKFKY